MIRNLAVSALLAAALLAGSAFAQDKAFDVKIANVQILQDKSVQSELNITEAQRAQEMNAAAAVQAAQARRLVEAARKAKQQALSKAAQVELRSGFMAMNLKVLNILSTAQVKRLRELTVQSAGTAALLETNVAKLLGITGPQKDKLISAFRTGQQQNATLAQNTLSPIAARYKLLKPKNAADQQKLQQQFQNEVRQASLKVRPQSLAIQTATAKKMLAVLTPSQKARFEALKGKPFRG